MAYFCNKCGYHGREGPQHSVTGCPYLAAAIEKPKKAFHWTSQAMAMKCPLFIKEPHHAHICIRSVDEKIKHPECNNPVLHLAFHDLGENAPENYRDGLFTEQQAKIILEFIRNVPDEYLIVVNCEAGVSRSPAVVLAFRKFYGGDTEEVYTKAHPNIHVSSIMERVLREGV